MSTIESFFGKGDEGLDLRELRKVEVEDKGNLQKHFEGFHRQNPHVLDLIMRIAVTLRHKKGFRKCGMRLIYNQLRWMYAIQTRGDEYKLNDHHTPYYARVVMALRPDLVDFFNVRRTAEPYEPDWDGLEIDPLDERWEAFG